MIKSLPVSSPSCCSVYSDSLFQQVTMPSKGQVSAKTLCKSGQTAHKQLVKIKKATSKRMRQPSSHAIKMQQWVTDYAAWEAQRDAFAATNEDDLFNEVEPQWLRKKGSKAPRKNAGRHFKPGSKLWSCTYMTGFSDRNSSCFTWNLMLLKNNQSLVEETAFPKASLGDHSGFEGWSMISKLSLTSSTRVSRGNACGIFWWYTTPPSFTGSTDMIC